MPRTRQIVYIVVGVVLALIALSALAFVLFNLGENDSPQRGRGDTVSLSQPR